MDANKNDVLRTYGAVGSYRALVDYMENQLKMILLLEGEATKEKYLRSTLEFVQKSHREIVAERNVEPATVAQ